LFSWLGVAAQLPEHNGEGGVFWVEGGLVVSGCGDWGKFILIF
jgi:hypothetical protein